MSKYRSLVSSFAEFSAYGLPDSRLVELATAKRLKRVEAKRVQEDGFTFGQGLQELTRKTALVRAVNESVAELLNTNASVQGPVDLYDLDLGTWGTSVTSLNTTLPTLPLEAIPYYRHSFALTVVFCVAYITIFIVGLVGNSFVIAVVLRSPRMRNVTNYFIMNLAFADMLVVILCLPATLLSNIFVPWVLGWYMCKVVPYVQGVSVAASVYSLIAVSLDRFLAIWWPLKYQITTRRARVMIMLIWLISLTFTLPWAFFFDLVSVFEEAPEIQVCLEMWPSPLTGLIYFFVINLIFFYLMPMFVITACYILIWARVSKRNIPTDAKDAALERMQQKSKVKVIKMLVAVVILFALSWLPLYCIFGWLKLFGETSLDTDSLQIVTPIAQWLGASNSCINPILYACFNKKFRKGFMELIRTWKICAPLRKYETVAMASSSTSTRKGSAFGPGGAVLRRQTTHDSCYVTSSAALRRQASQETYFVNDEGRILPRQASQDSSNFGSERGGILKRQTSNDSNRVTTGPPGVKPISTVVGVLARAGSGDSSTSRTRFSTKTDSISEEATGDFTAELDGFTTSVSNSVDIEDITPEQIDAITNANTNANALTALEFDASLVSGFVPAPTKAPLVQVHSFPRAKGIPRMAPRRQMSHETRVSFMYECTRV